MLAFRKLATASTIATLALVAIGGLVRATKSGLGCGTDWPHCSGKLIPALETRAEIIEFSHRAAASVVIVLLALLAVTAVRRHRAEPTILWPSIAAVFLVLSQALLGLIVVKLELQAQSVALHLAVALALVAVLVFVTLRAFALERPLGARTDASSSRRAFVAAAAVLGLMLVGSYLGGKGARLSPTEWPLLDGRLVPDLSHELTALHFLHRVLAIVAGVLVVVAALPRIRNVERAQVEAKLAHVALGTFAVQVLLGAMNVWTELNPAVVALHLVFGAVLWASLVALAIVSHPSIELPSDHVVVARSRPALGQR